MMMVKIIFPLILSWILFESLQVYSERTDELAHVGLPQLFAYGDHWEVGKIIGSTFRLQIQERLNSLESLIHLKQWIETNDLGKRTYLDFVRTNNNTYPEYFLELEAMAEGSSVSLEDLLILNMRNELLNAKAESEGWGELLISCNDCFVDHCSDYMMFDSEGNPLLAHNEDGDVGARGTSFLLWGKLTGAGVREEISFLSLVYPGELPTNAFFVNEFGISGSMNGLYPKHSVDGGLGRNFISRDLIGARNESDALQRIHINHQSTGHNYNFIFPSHDESNIGKSAPDWKIVTAEIAPNIIDPKGMPISSVAELKNPFKFSNHSLDRLFHANSYLRLKIEETDDKVISSQHRLATVQGLGAPQNWGEIQAILGDTSDPLYPIYRTARSPDSSYTLMTVLFKVRFNRLDIFLTNPDPKKGGNGSKISVGLHF